MPIQSDIQRQERSPIVELFELSNYDLADASAVFRFNNYQQVTWQRNIYIPLPVEATGFEFSGGGQLPRPKMRISNVSGVIGSLIRQYNDLIGAKLTRRRTLEKYLDGQPTADPTAEFEPDIYYVERKVNENSEFVEWELSSSIDLEELQLPRRLIVSSVCIWRYRDANCGYTGSPVADVNDNPTTDPARDQCSKSIRGCQYRFDPGLTNQPLPWGGFPGSTRF